MKRLIATVLFSAIVSLGVAAQDHYFLGKQVPSPLPPGIYYTIKRATDHGGYDDNMNFGANAGDTFVLEVDCDHPGPLGLCLMMAPFSPNVGPWLVSCPNALFGPCDFSSRQLFELDKDHSRYFHQEYTAIVPANGNWFLSGSYFWLGPDVNYHTKVTATEVIQ